MISCNGNGTTITEQLLPDAFYHLQGTISPNESADIACAYAVAQLKANGLDPLDPNNSDDLDHFFQEGLASNAQVASTEPLSNQIQKAYDVLSGSASSSAQVTKTPPVQSSSSTLFIVGVIVILGIGFVLVFK